MHWSEVNIFNASANLCYAWDFLMLYFMVGGKKIYLKPVAT